MFSPVAMPVVFIGIGANLGQRKQTLWRAVRDMASTCLCSEAVSPLYESEYVGVGPSQPPYMNAVVRGRSRLHPLKLLDRLQEIETSFGRYPGTHMQPRLLDLDILYYGSLWVRHPRLILPHPRIAERRFVMQPLDDLEAPELGIGRPRRHQLRHLSAKQHLTLVCQWEELGEQLGNTEP